MKCFGAVHERDCCVTPPRRSGPAQRCCVLIPELFKQAQLEIPGGHTLIQAECSCAQTEQRDLITILLYFLYFN